MKRFLCMSLLAMVSSMCSAESCLPFLPTEGRVTLALVTMNKNGVASYVESEAWHRKLPARLGGAARVTTVGESPEARTTPQVFSDHKNQFLVSTVQRFDAATPDQVSVWLSVEASPQVTLTLVTQGNVKTRFRVSCSAGGVMHGSTPDEDYLLVLTPPVPIL